MWAFTIAQFRKRWLADTRCPRNARKRPVGKGVSDFLQCLFHAPLLHSLI